MTTTRPTIAEDHHWADDILTAHAPKPALTPSAELPWCLGIEPIEGNRRWRIYLYRGHVRFGLDGWGWTARSLPAARRKGLRKLAKREAAEHRMARRRALLRGEFN